MDEAHRILSSFYPMINNNCSDKKVKRSDYQALFNLTKEYASRIMERPLEGTKVGSEQEFVREVYNLQNNIRNHYTDLKKRLPMDNVSDDDSIREVSPAFALLHSAQCISDEFNRDTNIALPHHIYNKYSFKDFVDNEIEDLRADVGVYNPQWMYLDSKIYSVYPRAPPTENKSHVLKLEASVGCAHNKCTYCTEYSNIKHNKKTFKQFEKHFNKVAKWFNHDLYQFKRAFLSGGDALSIKQEHLLKMIELVNNGTQDVGRISAYASTRSILEKSWQELRKLERNDLECVYWGIESGHEPLLKYVNKDITDPDKIIEAGKKLENAGIDASVMVMPGLGGQRFYNGHVEDTVDVLNEIQPKWLTLMSISTDGKTSYDKKINRSKNEPLNRSQTIFQIYEMIDSLDYFNCKVGCYEQGVTPVADNPVDISGDLDREKGQLIADLGKQKVTACVKGKEVTASLRKIASMV